MSKELLLEIGTEEIPADYLENAIDNMKQGAADIFEQNMLVCKDIHAFATPRRLILRVGGVMETQKTVEEKIFGPPLSRAYDDAGNPTKAALGFAKSRNLPVESLLSEKNSKGEYLYACKVIGGESTVQKLRELLPEFILNIPFPKTMKWGNGNIRFVRPIHWILAMFGDKVIPFNLEGIKSSNFSMGHRFMSPEKFIVKDVAEYSKQLSERFVEIDQEKRRSSILTQVEDIAKKLGGVLIKDEELLETVSFMVEHPVAVYGEFDKKYLDLPQELLITSMKEHQKYFAVHDKNKELLPYFITITNLNTETGDIIRTGNERVLSARFADAYFFFEEDKKITFADYAERLKSVLFQKQLGTVFEKVERIGIISEYLTDKLDSSVLNEVKRAAYLCKADLVTHMIYEFPELQGIMGREYAKLSGETEAISRAIYEHYLPGFAADMLPESLPGAIIGIADRVDTICGCFGIGLLPTGSQDPHALRRQALAIINIIINKKYDINLVNLIKTAIEGLEGKLTRNVAEIEDDVVEFFKIRLKSYLELEGFETDMINATISVNPSNLVDTVARLTALVIFREKSDFDAIIIAFKRIMNILPTEYSFEKADSEAFQLEDERTLYAAFYSVKETVDDLVSKKDFNSAFSTIAAIREPIDNFFEAVMVMDKNEKVRNNRLNLLGEISRMFSGLADFSRIH